MTAQFIATFKAARRVGTSLVGVQTPDPAATIERLQRDGIAEASPIIRWDVVRGWSPVNKAGQLALEALLGSPDDVDYASATGNPVEMLIRAQQLPDKTVLFAVNAHRPMADPSGQGAAYVQAIWNLRDPFKSNFRTLVLLAPTLILPAELGGDVLVLDEPLPSDDELRDIVDNILDASEMAEAQSVERSAIVERSVDALRGLASFPAEQVTAMACVDRKVAFDPAVLWERKRKMISATPGLSVWQGRETLDDVGGNAQIKLYLRKILTGKKAPRAVVWFDEIEKMIAGATGIGDSSGVSQGQLQSLLTWMQELIDKGSQGLLLLGPPGAGKSAIAKATGGTGKIPTIACDLNGMKASLVGESEMRLRNAQKVIDAVGGGRVLFIGTCNAMATIPSPLRRRFTAGIFYVDLPDVDERSVIWELGLTKAGLSLVEPRPDDSGWTGAEIMQACRLRDDLDVPLVDTPQFIVPVSKSAAEEIKALRDQANNRYLSAAHPGLFQTGVARVDQPSGKPVARRLASSKQEV